MAIAVRAVAVGTNATSAATFTAVTDSTPQVGDVMVIAHINDFYLLTNMSTPSVTGAPTVTPVTNGTADAGNNVGHIKTYTAVVNTAGANTVTFAETGSHDEEKIGVVIVLSGADTTTPVDIAGSTFSASSGPTRDAPSIAPSTSTAMLIAFLCSINGANVASWTAPGSMAERSDTSVGGSVGSTSATEQLAASGATGVRTFTPAASCPYAAVSVAIRTASGGGGATQSFDAVVTNTATLTADASKTTAPDASLTAVSAVTAAASLTKPVDSARAVSVAVTAAAGVVKPVDAALPVGAAVAAATGAVKPVDASLPVAATATSATSVVKPVAAALSLTLTRAADATIGALVHSADAAVAVAVAGVAAASAVRPVDVARSVAVAGVASMAAVKVPAGTLGLAVSVVATASVQSPRTGGARESSAALGGLRESAQTLHGRE